MIATLLQFFAQEACINLCNNESKHTFLRIKAHVQQLFELDFHFLHQNPVLIYMIICLFSCAWNLKNPNTTLNKQAFCFLLNSELARLIFFLAFLKAYIEGKIPNSRRPGINIPGIIFLVGTKITGINRTKIRGIFNLF